MNLPHCMKTCTCCRQAIVWAGPRKDGARTGRCRCGEWFASAGLLRAEQRRAAPVEEAEGLMAFPMEFEPSAA